MALMARGARVLNELQVASTINEESEYRRSTERGNEDDRRLGKVGKDEANKCDFRGSSPVLLLRVNVLSLQVLVQVDGVLAGNRSVAIQSGLLGLRGLGRHYGNLMFKNIDKTGALRSVTFLILLHIALITINAQQ